MEKHRELTTQLEQTWEAGSRGGPGGERSIRGSKAVRAAPVETSGATPMDSGASQNHQTPRTMSWSQSGEHRPNPRVCLLVSPALVQTTEEGDHLCAQS